MNRIRQGWTVLTTRLGVAGTAALCVGGCVLATAGIGAVAVANGSRVTAPSLQQVQRVRDVVLAGVETTALQSCLEAEGRTPGIERLAVGAGNRITAASPRDLAGQDAEFALASPGLAGRLGATDGSAPNITTRDGDLFEAVLAIGPGPDGAPRWVYLSAHRGIYAGGPQWPRVLGFGALLAAVAGGAAFWYVQVAVVRRLRGFIHRVRLDPTPAEPPGGLQPLIDELRATLQRHSTGLEQHTRLALALGESQDAIRIQTELLGVMIKDLRGAMSAVLGHADLLMTCDPRVSDRINYIRAIQKEARRLSRLAQRITVILPRLQEADRSAAGSGHADDPLAQLREVIEEISAVRSSLQLGASSDAFPPPDPAPADPAVPHEIKHLRGNVLLVGRSQTNDQTLLRALHELGINAVAVPDLTSVEQELTRSAYDTVLVKLNRRDGATRQLLAQIRALHPDGGIVAVLPETARGVGQDFLELGCDDYLFAPITRGTLLAVVGKYLGFEALAESTPPDGRAERGA